ncbi:hypothetical protein QTL86_06495 [Cellulosilyticum sp. ST5]
MKTIKITISELQSEHIVVKGSTPKETELTTKLIKLLKIIQPKEALQQ